MNSNIREVDINEYMPILIDLVNKGNTVPLLISGNSMSPFLVHHRDTIYISKPNKPLKKGDIVFFLRKNGQYILHRIHHIDKFGKIFVVGDAQTVIEGPLELEQIFGIVHSIKRKNKLITDKSFIWKFFSIVWIKDVYIRKILVKFYSRIKFKSK